MLGRKLQILQETIRKLLQLETDQNLKNVLDKSLPADIGHVMSFFNQSEQERILKSVTDLEKKSSIVCEMEIDLVRCLLPDLGVEQTVKVLESISPDDTADIIESLPADFRENILRRLEPEESKEVEELIQYKSESAGGIMSPEVFTLKEDLTVKEAMKCVQEAEDVENVFYLYVVNQIGTLVGVLSLKKLLLVAPNRLLKEIMDPDPIRVRIDEDQEEVARMVARYNYLSVPVVNEENKLIGVITVDDVLDVVREEATEDILLMSGAEKEAIEQASLWTSLRSRLPWLFLTLVGGLVASEVIFSYSDAILKSVILIGFLPLMLSLVSSVGQQAVTISVRGMAIGRLNFSRIGWFLVKELRNIIVIGLIYSSLISLFILFRHDVAALMAIAVGGALMVAMFLSVFVGLFIPILFEKFGFDPAMATIFVVRFLSDLLAVVLYFSLVSLFLNTLQRFSFL